MHMSSGTDVLPFSQAKCLNKMDTSIDKTMCMQLQK